MEKEIIIYKEKLEQKKQEKPIWEKNCLTIEEAAKYSGVGCTKIRSLIRQKKCPFIIQLGRQSFIIRQKFDRFLEKHTHI